jgi:hypothetical protein
MSEEEVFNRLARKMKTEITIAERRLRSHQMRTNAIETGRILNYLSGLNFALAIIRSEQSDWLEKVRQERKDKRNEIDITKPAT